MMWKLLVAVALATRDVHALLRFACGQLVVERFDPLVNPGEVSPHLHQVVGGNAFNITMDPNNDLPGLSTCTTCTFTQDFSNYWTAVMYFRHANGSYKRVPQLPGLYTGNANGGMTVYYIQGEGTQGFHTVSRTKLTAFQKGFRMIVGDASLRTVNTSSAEAQALSFRCWSRSQELQPNPGEGLNSGLDTHILPDKACAGGIRAQIYFPTCWDGKNLDSPDHKSHVSYRTNGNCPSSHPIVLPQVFLETIWDTRGFNSMYPTDGTQPFVFSMGDPTGAGQHADYVFGWKDDSLQKAMDQCTNISGQGCSVLQTQSAEAANRCVQSQRVEEAVDGWIESLPGCNPIQAGPGRAIPQSGCGAPTTYTP